MAQLLILFGVCLLFAAGFMALFLGLAVWADRIDKRRSGDNFPKS